MSEGSDRKPGDAEAGDAKGQFDEKWAELVHGASTSGAGQPDDATPRDGASDANTTSPGGGEVPAADEGGTRRWDDVARAEPLRAASSESTGDDEPLGGVEKTGATKPWDDAARALPREEHAEDVPAARSADDLKMDALMAEAAAAAKRARREAAEVAERKATKARPATRSPWLERSDEWLERSSEQMERLMSEPPPKDDTPDEARAEPASSGAAKQSAEAKAGGGAKGAASSDAHEADVDTKSEAEASKRDAEAGAAKTPRDSKGAAKSGAAKAPVDANGDAEPARIVKTDDRDPPRRSGAVSDEGPPPRADAGAGRGRLWILLAAIFGLFGIWALIPDPPREPIVPTLDADRPAVPLGPAAEHPGAPPNTRPDARPADAPPVMERPAQEADAQEADAQEAEPDSNEMDDQGAPAGEPTANASDLREPPPGTAPEHAEAFRRLPVAEGDGPPVGGVGEGGVHLDHISLGSAYDRGQCEGKLDDFSVAQRDRVNVCLRVVHPREKEEVVVLWQKDGDTIRRGKVTIAAQHAYRTRAYLMLRGSYVGRWAVRVFSRAGVELASHEFQVVP